MEGYCLDRIAGLTPVEAYTKNYDTKTSKRSTVYNAARSLEADPRIIQRLTQLREKREAQTVLAQHIDRTFVLQGVAEIATNIGNKPEVRLRAYELLGKSAGVDLFRETTVTVRQDRTPEQIESELRKRLETLRPLLEGQAKDITPANDPA